MIAIDSVLFRLQFAQEKLGIETINFNEHKDVPKRLRELVGEKGVDVAIDCGKALSINQPCCSRSLIISIFPIQARSMNPSR